MSVRLKYVLYIVFVHVLLGFLCYLLFRNQMLCFFLSELLILSSVVFSVYLYRETIRPIEFLLAGKDALADQDFSVKFRPTSNKEVNQLVEVYNQMIDKLREERTLQAQQHFFLDKLIQTAPNAILILDFDEKIARLNYVAEELLGATSEMLEGKKLIDVKHPIVNSLSNLALDEQQTFSLEGVKVFRCQKTRFVDRGFHRIFITIEELTLEILRAEKKAYGKVIRMMAHEVNNSIGAVNSLLGTLQSYQNDLPVEEQEDYGKALQVAIERNQAMNYFMRNFADVVRLPKPAVVSQDLNQVIMAMVSLMRPKANEKDIELMEELATEPIFFAFDRQQLEQVLINVIKNSIEAIGENGKIVVQTSINPVGFKVMDNGPGISEEKVDQLFSPFFSTKSSGQGIGLTLSREILLNHGCQFSLNTQEDGWTVFRVEL